MWTAEDQLSADISRTWTLTNTCSSRDDLPLASLEPAKRLVFMQLLFHTRSFSVAYLLEPYVIITCRSRFTRATARMQTFAASCIYPCPSPWSKESVCYHPACNSSMDALQ